MATAPLSSSPQSPFRGKRVLIVEDDSYFRGVLRGILEAEGMIVEEAHHGAQAQMLILGGPYDLVISDIAMPQLSGVELLKWLRAQKSLSHNPAPPLILLTGFGELAEVNEAHRSGVNFFMPKTARREETLGAIRWVLANRGTYTSALAAIRGARNLDEDFYPLQLEEDCLHFRGLVADIHLRLSESLYVKVAHSMEELNLDPKSAATLVVDRGLSLVHVRRTDLARYLGFLPAPARQVLKSDRVGTQQRSSLVARLRDVVAGLRHGNPVAKEHLDHAARWTEIALCVLCENKELLDLLLRLNLSYDFVFGHSVCAAFYAALLARELQITSPRDRFHVIAAGLVHDLGKAEFPRELLLKDKRRLNLGEVQILQTHCRRATDRLQKVAPMTRDLLTIVYQHHEGVNGTGFPDRVRRDRIHPLALVLAIANEYAGLTAEEVSGSGRTPAEAVKELAVTHIRQLDRPAFVALMKMLGVEPPIEFVNVERAELEERDTAMAVKEQRDQSDLDTATATASATASAAAAAAAAACAAIPPAPTAAIQPPPMRKKPAA